MQGPLALGIAAVLGVLLGVACDEVVPPEHAIACVTAAITGGSDRAEYLALTPMQEAAICRLEVSTQSGGSGLCSGVLIAPTTVLTAAHCLRGSVAATAHFITGIATSVVGVRSVRTHPDLDLAMLELEEAILSIEPLQPLQVSEVQPATGATVQVGGYGRTETGALGERRFLTGQIVQVTSTLFRIEAGGRGAACDGDSGGPVLVRDASGRASIVGVLSSGSTTCAGIDNYVRVSAGTPWLDLRQYASDQDIGGSCEFIGTTGRCFGNVAMWCENEGRSHADVCQSDELCGYDPTEQGFRCIRRGEEACKGVGDRGLCKGSDRLRCVRGKLQLDPCSECRAKCTLSVHDGRAICNGVDAPDGG